mgnify:CR=1 FL=1
MRQLIALLGLIGTLALALAATQFGSGPVS